MKLAKTYHKKYDYLIVGAGFAGSVFAERLASQLDKKILLVEKRNHVAGNAYDELDKHGILIHRYGPHIFHTNSKKVFDYLSQFTKWRFYEHKVLAFLNGNLFPVPINRITLNKLYDFNFQTEKEVNDYINSIKVIRYPVLNSEDVIVSKMGNDLFEKFFRHYTKKQWGREPKELAASVCGRIPIRTNDDCRYFTDNFQFMPSDGYSAMFHNMLNHPNIEIVLNTDYKKIIDNVKFDKMIYTGPIDYFFDYEFGGLPYRSIKFEFINYPQESIQDNAVINYVEKNVNYSRVTEYKYLTGQKSETSTISREFFQQEGDPFYPIPTEHNKELYDRYFELTKSLESVLFCGRLAEYQYYNMDQVVANILHLFEKNIL